MHRLLSAGVKGEGFPEEVTQKLREDRVVCCCVETEGSTPQAGRHSPGAWKPVFEGQSGGGVRVWEGGDRRRDQKVG